MPQFAPAGGELVDPRHEQLLALGISQHPHGTAEPPAALEIMLHGDTFLLVRVPSVPFAASGGDAGAFLLEPVLVPHPQRAPAGVAELPDRVCGAVLVFDVQVHGPVTLLPAVLRHKGVLLPVGKSKKTSPPRSDELLPTVPVLLHALGHADDLPAPLLVDADGDEDADVLHVPAPGALVPHAVHEHVRALALQWPRAPRVDVPVHLLELVGERLRGHPLSPQQLADVVDPPGAHAGQVHVDQRLLDALLAPAVAFDHGRLEDRALQLGDPEPEFAGLGGQAPFVVAGPVRPSSVASLVSRGVGDLVRLKRRASR